MTNVVPIQALVVGIVGLVVAFAWLPMMKAAFSKSQQELLKSANGHNTSVRSQQVPHLVRAASSVLSKFNDVILTVFRWLCIAVSVLAILVYAIGFFGINLAKVVLGHP